jgi:hypothetical protein
VAGIDPAAGTGPEEDIVLVAAGTAAAGTAASAGTVAVVDIVVADIAAAAGIAAVAADIDWDLEPSWGQPYKLRKEGLPGK